MTTLIKGFRPNTHAAEVQVHEPSHGLFGEMILPSIVWQGLQFAGSVGKMDDPKAAEATQALHSFTCHAYTDQVMIEFDNSTSYTIAVKWMDELGQSHEHYNFTLPPVASEVQYSRLGHLFVFSIIQGSHEFLLGAYRLRMPLPSGSPHYIRIEQESVADSPEILPLFIFESVLSDPTKHDELVIAAEALDCVGKSNVSGSNRSGGARTIKTLHTIIHNLVQHPHEAKFQSLRLFNAKIQSQIVQHWGAMHLLRTVGFSEKKEDDDTYLVLTSPMDHKPQLDLALKLLAELLTRSQPGFVAELAPTPPWQGPILNSSHHASSKAFSQGTSFVSDDEKWARVERNRARNRRAGRRPDPGNAPSSNGPWGR